ncbi:hypothetical protein [uncultured Litoreibacter sp.]|uniref:hypothetical protein n=1 Tax=uncultured Litoreibacter sp. TaxID=1392394 RepID=UPI002620E922|nr:hypothetical protein [uncultured Litoreibacter sp.]
MMKPILVAFGLSMAVVAAPVAADPNPQLVNSVQHRLNVIGFSKVDAGTLSTAQIAALHTKLQGNYTFGYARIRTQQEVKMILQWDGSENKGL